MDKRVALRCRGIHLFSMLQHCALFDMLSSCRFFERLQRRRQQERGMWLQWGVARDGRCEEDVRCRCLRSRQIEAGSCDQDGPGRSTPGTAPAKQASADAAASTANFRPATAGDARTGAPPPGAWLCIGGQDYPNLRDWFAMVCMVWTMQTNGKPN